MRIYWRILIVAATLSAVIAADLTVRGHSLPRPIEPGRPAGVGQTPSKPVVEDWTGPTRTTTVWR
jgi:hypothetical protein